MATAKKLPSGNYRVRVYMGKGENGKPKYASITEPSKKEAERKAALLEYRTNEKATKGLKIGDVLELYIQNNTNVLSPASIRKYDTLRKNNFPSIENKYVCDMKQTDYQAFVNEISMDYSPKSVSSICGLLTAALKAYDPSTVPILKKPQLKKAEITIPTDEQVKNFIDSAGSEGMRLAFVLGASLGMRRSEICALSWDDIEGNILHIKKAMVQDKANNWVIKGTKTTAGTRDIILPDFILKMLSEYRKSAKETDLIFDFSPDAITMSFMRVSKKAGIHCRFHDLRHYNASVMLALGVPDKYAMHRMGHATPNMLKNVYQHLIDEKEKSVATDVNSYMNDRLKTV